MPEPQYRSVKGLSAEPIECRPDLGGQPAGACRVGPAVDRIPEQGMAGMSHVHPDLVGTAGLQTAFDQRGGAGMLKRLQHVGSG